MATKKTLNIGLIGGGFMGRTHSNGYRRVPNFFPDLEYIPVLKAVCFRNETKAKAFAEQWGYESFETDWRKIIARADIDAVDIAPTMARILGIDFAGCDGRCLNEIFKT